MMGHGRQPVRRLDHETIRRAFLDACAAEIETLKPGNVHRFAPGHGMEAATFEASALASAPFIALHGAPVGQRILEATKASWAAVGLNANLGIVLLCAPLARAAEQISLASSPGPHSGGAARALQAATQEVLGALDADDAVQAFQAIALASPGGLGERDEHDVREAPAIGLVDAMGLAADIDLVARQFTNGFADIFEVGLAAMASTQEATDSPSEAVRRAPGLGPVLNAYLNFAQHYADSHIVRKFGPVRAENVRQRFKSFARSLAYAETPEEALSLAAAFDAELKGERINPGTSADLTVASVFAFNLAEAMAE